MIWTVCRISMQRMWNNKQEMALALIVPILFFSIFALIFSRGVGQSVSQVRVAFVDDDHTAESMSVIRAASQRAEIKADAQILRTNPDWPIERLARWLISHREFEVVVHVPTGFTQQDPDSPTLSIGLFNEGINPIGHRLVQACLAESIAMELSKAQLQSIGPQPTVSFASASGNVGSRPNDQLAERSSSESVEPQVFSTIDVFASSKHEPRIASFAAGIAVMFLLFGANAAGGSLLEERESGTLERLLSSRLTLGELLLGKWLFITGLGCLQVALMFVWGQLFFQVDLVGHLPGFLVMTFATAAACSSFGLFLAAICRSRQQLHAVSVVLVLSMSAVGGSMVPRYIMSDSIKRLGKFTFNGWALDGFQKIFWYDLPLSAIRLELSVLLAITGVLGLAALVLARRWSVA